MDTRNTAKLHPRTVRLMRELAGPATCEQTRRNHEEVAEMIQRARVEQAVAIANLLATCVAAMVNAVRRLVGMEPMASSAS